MISKEDRLVIKTIASLPQKPIKCLFVNRDTIVIATDFGFNSLNNTGTVKQTLTFPESEGKVTGIDILGAYMVIWTQSSYVRVFSIGTEIKQIGQSRRF